ncbi:MAG: hypothetical protein HGA96_04310 [Desulfobulbaceae bacterium]|nr:hypothetical protein [Desulfobulbaceae bacterium]
MNLNELIKERLKGQDLNVVAAELGYHNREKGGLRIRDLVESENLGVGTSGYDFKYSNKELLSKLCELLGIDRTLCDEHLCLVNAEQLIEERRFAPHIFVDTGFRRNNEPIFVLALLESTRYIRLPDAIGRLPLRQQLPHVKDLVRRHYSSPHGEAKLMGALPIWGEILGYIYRYNDFVVLELNPEGMVINARAKYDTPLATLSLNGREIRLPLLAETQAVKDAVVGI